VLDIEYTDGSTPYVRAIFLKEADAFRYWRWVEQWKTRPGVIDGIWANPFFSSALQLYAGPTEPTPRPKMYHGLVTIRTDTIQRAQRVVLTISGREINTRRNDVAYIRTAEIDLWMQVSVRGIKVLGAAYFMPDYQPSPIAPHGWVREAFDVKRVVDFILMLAGVVGRVAGLLGFATGEGLKSAGDAVKTQVLDENAARITYRRGWYTNVASDTIIIPLVIPSLSWRDTPTELEITRVCLDGRCVNPSLKAYVQPDLVYYATSIHSHLKNWMFRGQVSDVAAYFIPTR
jgi:hypothetical protein